MTDIITLSQAEKDPAKIAFVVRQLAERVAGGALANLDITGGTALTTPAVDDEIPIHDLSATSNKKIALLDFFKVIGLLTAETAPATDDGLVLFDTSAGTADFITLANALKVINALTEDTAPDGEADFLLTYDASASAVKKVLLHRTTSFKVGSFTRDLTTATGTQAITGVGFKPKALLFLSGVASAAIATSSIGFGTASANMDWVTVTGTGSGIMNTGACISVGSTGSDYQVATISSMDSDGFTVSWTKVLLPTGTATIVYLALR